MKASGGAPQGLLQAQPRGPSPCLHVDGHDACIFFRPSPPSPPFAQRLPRNRRLGAELKLRGDVVGRTSIMQQKEARSILAAIRKLMHSWSRKALAGRICSTPSFRSSSQSSEIPGLRSELRRRPAHLCSDVWTQIIRAQHQQVGKMEPPPAASPIQRSALDEKPSPLFHMSRTSAQELERGGPPVRLYTTDTPINYTSPSARVSRRVQKLLVNAPECSTSCHHVPPPR